MEETEATDDRSMDNSGDPTPLCQRSAQSNPAVISTGDSRDERSGAIALGCTTATTHSSPGCVEDVGQLTDLPPQISPAPRESHAHQTEAPYFDSTMRGGENWGTGETASVAVDSSVIVGRLPNQILSPSISSGYHVEDGIFEHGSAYRNLFQSLRSQVFRTAQFESKALDESLRLRSESPPGRDSTNGIPAADGGGEIYAYKHAASFQTFELQLTQEYLLWKAWTEEVSIWV